MMGVYREGERVWVRGRYAQAYSLRGVIETVVGEGWPLYGVRLENGNYMVCDANQLRERGNL